MAISNDQFDFTVITPVFNGEEFIQETLQSILKWTTGLSKQILVIDDGSTDSTPLILETFGESITVIRQVNSGQASAINHGFEYARGTYSIIVNADDPLCSEHLFIEAKKVLSKSGGIVAVYPDWQIIDEAGEVVRSIKVKEFSRNELVGNFNCIIGPGGIFRTSAAREVGGWSSSYRYVPDYDFWLKLSAHGDFQRIPGFHALWREHNASISVSSKGLEMAKERIRVISEHVYQRAQDLDLEKIALSNAYFQAAILGFFDSRVPARTWFFQAFRLSPINILGKKKKTILYLGLYPVTRVLVAILLKFRFLNLGKAGYK